MLRVAASAGNDKSPSQASWRCAGGDGGGRNRGGATACFGDNTLNTGDGDDDGDNSTDGAGDGDGDDAGLASNAAASSSPLPCWQHVR